jgi:hypothetical protein
MTAADTPAPVTPGNHYSPVAAVPLSVSFAPWSAIALAYLNFLAAATTADIQALSKDASVVLEPSLVVAVSHLIGYWVEVQPLGKLLGQAVDGGTAVSPDLWHPLRPPVYHRTEAVQALHRQLAEEWQRVLAEKPVPEDDWYRIEIEKVLRLFRHASDRAECVVSILERPGDQERASKVRIPLKGVGGRG